MSTCCCHVVKLTDSFIKGLLMKNIAIYSVGYIRISLRVIFSVEMEMIAVGVPMACNSLMQTHIDSNRDTEASTSTYHNCLETHGKMSLLIKVILRVVLR